MLNRMHTSARLFYEWCWNLQICLEGKRCVSSVVLLFFARGSVAAWLVVFCCRNFSGFVIGTVGSSKIHFVNSLPFGFWDGWLSAMMRCGCWSIFGGVLLSCFFFLFAKWVCWFEFFAEGRLFLLVFGCFRVFWRFRNEAGVCMGIGGLFLLAGCMYSSASLIDIEVLGVLVF